MTKQLVRVLVTSQVGHLSLITTLKLGQPFVKYLLSSSLHIRVFTSVFTPSKDVLRYSGQEWRFENFPNMIFQLSRQHSIYLYTYYILDDASELFLSWEISNSLDLTKNNIKNKTKNYQFWRPLKLRLLARKLFKWSLYNGWLLVVQHVVFQIKPTFPISSIL